MLTVPLLSRVNSPLTPLCYQSPYSAVLTVPLLRCVNSPLTQLCGIRCIKTDYVCTVKLRLTLPLRPKCKAPKKENSNINSHLIISVSTEKWQTFFCCVFLNPKTWVNLYVLVDHSLLVRVAPTETETARSAGRVEIPHNFRLFLQ